MATQTNSSSRVYTYRNGKKIYLKKEPDQFVVREGPEKLPVTGVIGEIEKVSPGSTRVTVSNDILDPLMEEMRKKAVTHHAYTQENNNAEFLITDRVIVTFREPVDNDRLSRFMAKYALILRNKYSEREYLFQLTDQTGMNPVKLVVELNEKENDLIESCEHDLNKRMQISAVNLPTDTKYIQQWHLHTRLINAAFNPQSSSNCEGAWNLMSNFGSPDVVIGVTDDGCKVDHTDFNSANKFAQWGYMEGTNLINRDSVSANPQNMYQNGADHGTCCCGVVAAETDGTLTVGAAPGCRLLPVKWQSSGPSLFISDSKLLTVLSFISDKVDILSNSWGSSPESNFASNVINKITQLAQNGGRRGKGIVFMWAAGNENCPIKYSGPLNIPYDNGYNEFGSWEGVNTSNLFEHNLVGIPGVMHIAALASNAQRSHYSNYGEGISLCAPSSNSHEYWRMAVTGLGITTTSGRFPFSDSEFGGTSSATPLVAGIAGLVISANPNLTALEVISVLQRTAGKSLSMTDYPKTLPALFDTDTSWDISPVSPFHKGDFTNINHPDGTWSPWFGFGKVDATTAVAEAIRLAGGTISENILNKTSAPSKSIPDNEPVGISDMITVDETGSISAIKITLDISHTYIGDLIIKLISPHGTTVVLHNRNGGSTKNINKTYDLQNTPSLSLLKGQPVHGDWILQIADVAAIDSGTLNNWKLQIGLSQDQSIILDDAPGMVIPDNNPVGIERILNTTNTGIIKEAEVGIDITHSYVGDLLVNLVSPGGITVSLHNKVGGSADNIIKTFNFNNTINLKSLRGEKVEGTWKLKVSDTAGQDIGKLNKWSLKLVKE